MLQKIEDIEMETNAMRNELFILWNKAISATNNPADYNVRLLKLYMSYEGTKKL